MKRVKCLEYSWIFKRSFCVNAYTVKHTNGKTYVVYAHDFTDMSTFLPRLECFEGGCATRQRDCFDHFETRKILSYIADKNGNPQKKPFWYRGRVYEVLAKGGEEE